MGANPEIASIDELVNRRLEELLPQKIEDALRERAEDIPLLVPAKRDQARRFNTLVDTLYEGHCRLVATAAGEPANLYPEGDGAFEFERTVSRLEEMRSAAWLEDAAE